MVSSRVSSETGHGNAQKFHDFHVHQGWTSSSPRAPALEKRRCRWWRSSVLADTWRTPWHCVAWWRCNIRNIPFWSLFFWHVIFYLLQEYIYIHSYDFMYVYIMYNYHRKFISQTSDNMDRWKAEMGRVREEKRREEERGSKKRQSEEKRKEERGSKKRQLEERRSRCAKR